ncbi:NYN domain-containing protein [Chroogloeocystis siderophila]|jgi:predicted RNA-binding protein with PIN domain|uniref:RNA-binding protein n=1 Tax=Chroogloeocystis siderophila 5.2 s.c.1 TaxID=247279 RepID=A0A1U7HID5_9CHRO|nr:NYN domain-containing protein [Chroogloeocystis siderophila]OKH23353.1 RNA-binding protein [Chroogloeocystis siderophila 5.2 s.c.1]
MPRSSPQAVLLVDGYNIIGAWSCLKKIRDSDGLEASRWQLIEDLTNYSAYQGYITQVVFDAHYQNTCSNYEVITETLSVYYTNFGETADTYIEKLCAGFRPYLRGIEPNDTTNKNSKLPIYSRISRIIVATSDRAQQLTVVGYGAEWLSAAQLKFEVQTTACRMRREKTSARKPASRFLANSIDTKARQRLAEMRMGIKKT